MRMLPRTTHDVSSAASWRAQLELRYSRDGSRTTLTRRLHNGPLVVQKPLYPEGNVVCHTIIVHPPGGIVGGDRLAIDVAVEPSAHAQITTPGAAKWYGSAGSSASQDISIRVEPNGVIEWLPQETIIYDGALARLCTRVELAGDAVFVGCDVVCLGRTASGERFRRGHFRQQIELWRDESLVWCERAVLSGDSPMLMAMAGLNHAPVFGTFLVASVDLSNDLITVLRSIDADSAQSAITRLPGVIVARYRGASGQAARTYFVQLWRILRPRLIGRDAVPPRIWNT